MKRSVDLFSRVLRQARGTGSVPSSSTIIGFSTPLAFSAPRLAAIWHGICARQPVLPRTALPRSLFGSWNAAAAIRGYQTLQFPARSRWRSPLSAEHALKALIAANVAGFIGWQMDPRFMQRHFLVSLQAVREGRIHTILTACFSHKDGVHLAANMLTLWFMCRWSFPSGRLVLFLYLAGGVVGNLTYLLDQYLKMKAIHPWGRDYAYRASMPALGASGAVNACVVFTILAQPYATVLIYGILPVPAFLIGALWVGGDISGMLWGGSGGQPIGHTAHLGGAVTGALAWYACSRGRLRL